LTAASVLDVVLNLVEENLPIFLPLIINLMLLAIKRHNLLAQSPELLGISAINFYIWGLINVFIKPDALNVQSPAVVLLARSVIKRTSSNLKSRS